jgi:hypothetical protein
MAGSTKGITVVAKLLGGKQIAVESDEINKSLESTGGAVKDADAEAGKAGGGYELFAAKQKAALDKSEKAHKSFLTKASGRASSMLSSTAGMLGLGGAAYGLYDSLKGGAAISALETSLRGALKNTGQLHGNTMAQITKATERSATHGGFAQSEQLEGITRLTTETGNSTLAQRLNTSATNLARGAHIEYSAALKMEQMGVTGSTGRLQKYLGIIQPVKTAVNAMSEAEKKANKPKLEAAELADKQATARKVQGLIEQKYGGATAAYNKTAAASLSNFKNSVKGLEDTIGKGLLPVAAKFLGFLLKSATFVGHSKVAMVLLGGALGTLIGVIVTAKVVTMAQSIASGIAAVKLFLFGAAATATTPATTGLAGAVGALDLSMGLMVIGFVAAGVAIYEIVTHFDVLKKVVSGVFEWIKSHWKMLAEIILAPLLGPVVLIVAHWTSFVGFFRQIPAKLAAAGKGMWNFVKTEFKSVIDWILSGWNKLHFRMPGVHTPFGTIGGFNIGLPHIPLLGEGGTVWKRGGVIVGDRGPELLNLEPGARVTPLTPGQRPQGAYGTWHGSGGSLTVICQIDKREVARAVLDEVGREFARGNR